MIPLWLFALGVTLALEVPVVAAVFRGQRARMALACVGATSATNLFMHLALPDLAGERLYVPVGEALALVVEAAFYWFVSRPRDAGRALVASALANGLSYGAGLLLFAR